LGSPGPDELAASLTVTTTGDVDQPPSVDVYGALLGTGSAATLLLDELVDRVGSDPASASRKHMSFPVTRRFWAHLGAAEEKAGEGSHPELVPKPYLSCKSRVLQAAAAYRGHRGAG
jgi:hypothetical protein